MISCPQGDVKHMGHVGLDGAYFGDIEFMSSNAPKVINNKGFKLILTNFIVFSFLFFF
jgi:hypothetical protein